MVMSNKSSEVRRGVMPSVPWQFATAGLAGAVFGGGLTWFLFQDVRALGVASGLYALAMTVVLRGVSARYPHAVMGFCNGATMARLVLVAVLVAGLVVGLFAQDTPAWPIFAVAVLAFALDGLDGWLARREGLTSAFGARFDMEVDSALALVLALLAWQSGTVGAYVIILGLPRYVFWLAQFAFPWLNGALPERFSRKVVCVVQIFALILALFPPVPAIVASGIAILSAVGLVWSFGADVRLLSRART